jgi:hypothetical protein
MPETWIALNVIQSDFYRRESYECVPPPCLASVLLHLWGLHLRCSLNIETTGSHVPHKNLDQVHAISMPDAAQTINRLPLDLSWKWFAYAHLLDPHLIPSNETFSLTLTTLALYQRSLRRFETCSCKPVPRGLPSSFAQLCTLSLYLKYARGTLRHIKGF